MSSSTQGRCEAMCIGVDNNTKYKRMRFWIYGLYFSHHYTSTICQSANCVETLESKSMQLIQIRAMKRLSPLPGYEPKTSMDQADVLPIELSRLGSLRYNYAIFVKVFPSP